MKYGICIVCLVMFLCVGCPSKQDAPVEVKTDVVETIATPVVNTAVTPVVAQPTVVAIPAVKTE